VRVKAIRPPEGNVYEPAKARPRFLLNAAGAPLTRDLASNPEAADARRKRRKSSQASTLHTADCWSPNDTVSRRVLPPVQGLSDRNRRTLSAAY
jgi:hypothetical protein